MTFFNIFFSFTDEIKKTGKRWALIIGINNYQNHFLEPLSMPRYDAKLIEDTLKNTDICFIFTEWNDIKTVNLNLFKKLMNKPIILDGRNCYSMDDVKKYDIIYESIGR